MVGGFEVSLGRAACDLVWTRRLLAKASDFAG
jgi:hypothetical protein